MRVRRRRPSRSHVQVQYRNIAGFDSQESGGAAGSGTKDAKANPQQDTGFRPPTGKHLEVVRLSDKEAGSSGTTKLRWLIMGSLLWGPVHVFSHAVDTPSQTSNPQKTTQVSTPPPSPLT